MYEFESASGICTYSIRIRDVESMRLDKQMSAVFDSKYATWIRMRSGDDLRIEGREHYDAINKLINQPE